MSTVDHLTLYENYIDIYNSNTITINSVTNASGNIDVDDNSNTLLSSNNAGRLVIDQCTTKDTSDGVLIYNSKYYTLFDSTFTTDEESKHFLILPDEQTSYKIGVLSEEPTSVVGNKLNLSLTGRAVFKLIINGEDIPSLDYSHDDTGVTVSGLSTNYITDVNDYIQIISYPDDQSLGVNSIVLGFTAPDVFYPALVDLQDNSAFALMTNITLFDSFSTTEGKSYADKNKPFNYIIPKRELDRENSISITMFEDIRDWIGDKQKFRLLNWNYDDNKLVVYNNCILLNGVSKTVNKTRIDLTYQINYEEELIFQY